MKKIIGWILVFFGVALFTGVLVELSDLKVVMLTYAITALIFGFVILVVWLLYSDS